MALERIVSMVLRAAELVFASIVAGVNGEYLHKSNASSWTLGRFIYTEVVAGIAIFLAILRLFPFASGFISWPVDIFISILWWVAFGLLVDVSPVLETRKVYVSDKTSSSGAAAAASSTGLTSHPVETLAAR